MADTIYNTKTISSERPEQLQRNRIDLLLSKAIEYPVVTVIAGARYGKTQSVSMFLRKTSMGVMWLKSSVINNHPERFWSELIHAISLFNKEISLKLEQLRFPDSLSKFNQFLHVLKGKMNTHEEFALVLDDFHLIQNASIITFIECLISAKIRNFRMILISRRKLYFNFTSVIKSEYVFQITAHDLYFNIEETKNYFEMRDILLTGKELDELQAYTEGWPFVLYHVYLSFKKYEDIPLDKLLSNTLPSIFDMFERETFNEYTHPVQILFIKLSLLSSFPNGLIKVLVDDHLEEVLKIINNNMFINYNPHTKHYNFHCLFFKFLNEKKSFLTAQEIADTYLTAADWCVTHNQTMNALTYYNKCNRYEEIWDVMIRNLAQLFSETVTDFYLDLISSFPEEFVRKNPMIHVIRAKFLLNNMDILTAKKELVGIMKELESKPLTRDNKIVLGEVYNMLALLSQASHNYDFSHLFKKACEYLPKGGILNNTCKSVHTRYAITLCSTAPGELEKMEKANFYAMPYAATSMNGYGHGFDYLAAAEAAYFTDNMNNAVKNAYEAVYRAREKQVSDVASNAYFLLMRIAASKGDYRSLISHLDQLKIYTESLEQNQDFHMMLDIAESWFYITVDQTEKVARWIMNDTLNNKILIPGSIGMEHLITANCLLKKRDHYELLIWIESLESTVRQHNTLLMLLEILIIKSIAFHRIHEETKSARALQEAYEIAHNNNLIMQFIVHGNPICNVIHAIKQFANHTISNSWLDSINTKANTYAKRIAFITAEYNKDNKLINEGIRLSKMERDILSSIYQGLTREEIAENLYISISAVKNTLNTIYNKLGALNKVDAIRIALHMRII